MIFALLITSVVLTAIAQVLLKLGAMQLDVVSGTPISQIALQVLSNFYLWCGATAFGASFLLWIVVLRSVDVSFAYPFISLGILIVTLFGYFYLNEAMGAAKLTGVALILVGVAMLAASR